MYIFFTVHMSISRWRCCTTFNRSARQSEVSPVSKCHFQTGLTNQSCLKMGLHKIMTREVKKRENSICQVCVYAYLYVFVYVYKCVYVYVCVCVCMCVYMCVCACACMCMCMCACMCVCVRVYISV